MATFTAGVIEPPAAVSEGCTVKASFEAAPAPVTLNAALVAAVSPVLEAASV